MNGPAIHHHQTNGRTEGRMDGRTHPSLVPFFVPGKMREKKLPLFLLLLRSLGVNCQKARFSVAKLRGSQRIKRPTHSATSEEKHADGLDGNTTARRAANERAKFPNFVIAASAAAAAIVIIRRETAIVAAAAAAFPLLRRNRS